MSKSILTAAAGAIVIILAVVLSLYLTEDDALPPAPTPAETQAPADTAVKAEELIPPTFDVVRVQPDGNAVIAGRAHPGSTVEVLDGDDIFGTVKADRRGEWVFVPGKLLEPGERRLGLRMLVEGHDPVLSEHVVILVVPEKGRDIAGREGESGALALKVRRDGTGASQVLQRPGGDAADAQITIDSVDYGDGGLSISGTGEPGLEVRLYVDNTFIGSARVGDDRSWSLQPKNDIAPGTYRLRADLTDSSGRVLARREIPFQRAADADVAALKAGSFVVVQPGNSLWRLARRTYGEGVRYHNIYEANRNQITDPNLIYPGQVFLLPEK